MLLSTPVPCCHPHRSPARHRQPTRAQAGPGLAGQLPPDLGQVPLPAGGAALPTWAGCAGGLGLGTLYALSRPEPLRAQVAMRWAPVAGAVAGPALGAALADPVHLLVGVGLGLAAYHRAAAPLLRRLGADEAGDELCRLGLGVAVLLAAAATP